MQRNPENPQLDQNRNPQPSGSLRGGPDLRLDRRRGQNRTLSSWLKTVLEGLRTELDQKFRRLDQQTSPEPEIKPGQRLTFLSLRRLSSQYQNQNQNQNRGLVMRRCRSITAAPRTLDLRPVLQLQTKPGPLRV